MPMPGTNFQAVGTKRLLCPRSILRHNRLWMRWRRPHERLRFPPPSQTHTGTGLPPSRGLNQQRSKLVLGWEGGFLQGHWEYSLDSSFWIVLVYSRSYNCTITSFWLPPGGRLPRKFPWSTKTRLFPWERGNLCLRIYSRPPAPRPVWAGGRPAETGSDNERSALIWKSELPVFSSSLWFQSSPSEASVSKGRVLASWETHVLLFFNILLFLFPFRASFIFPATAARPVMFDFQERWWSWAVGWAEGSTCPSPNQLLPQDELPRVPYSFSYVLCKNLRHNSPLLLSPSITSPPSVSYFSLTQFFSPSYFFIS